MPPLHLFFFFTFDLKLPPVFDTIAKTNHISIYVNCTTCHSIKIFQLVYKIKKKLHLIKSTVLML